METWIQTKRTTLLDHLSYPFSTISVNAISPFLQGLPDLLQQSGFFVTSLKDINYYGYYFILLYCVFSVPGLWFSFVNDLWSAFSYTGQGTTDILHCVVT